MDYAADVCDANLVMVDLGAFPGLLNRNMIASCDVVVPPAFLDKTSLDGLKAMFSETMPSIYTYHSGILEDEEKIRRAAEHSWGDGAWLPRFAFRKRFVRIAPVMVQNYTMDSAGGNNEGGEGGGSSEPVIGRYHSDQIHDLRRWLADAGHVPAAVAKEMLAPPSEMVLPMVPNLAHVLRDGLHIIFSGMNAHTNCRLPEPDLSVYTRRFASYLSLVLASLL
jgi:hypothetical protein